VGVTDTQILPTTEPAKQNAYPVYRNWGGDVIRYYDDIRNEWVTELEFSARFGIPAPTLRTWRYNDRKRAKGAA
jgi:hypothetical protein